uniref:Transcription factor bHLH28 n=1 Tax=Nothapodytes nimmoniana TaxID=159386 RepID=A0A9E9C1K1_NOTNI|nr:transcription factor bHLH28 [Nothapodytes nimmoniana]
MEYNEYSGFLEELLALRNEPLQANIPAGMNELYTNGWNSNSFGDIPASISLTSSLEELSLPFDQSLNCPFSEFYQPFGEDFSRTPEITDSSSNKFDTPPFQDYPLSIMDDEEQGFASNVVLSLEMQAQACKLEPFLSTAEVPTFNIGICEERKNKSKKLDGQPSKNLMAERRRRKRLNDRLSMLRSVVPKISKMDRTSILGDAIDYMKELLERINHLQEEIEEGSNQMNLTSIFKVEKPKEILVRNSPRFDVERRPMDTRIDISCPGKPGLLLSTVATLEALGLEVQQCVISCFNDFAMQASCLEELEHGDGLSSDEIKQALFRNAGYGGRCL